MSQDKAIAVVGAGAMGGDHVARVSHAVSGAVVAAVVDPDLDRAKAAAASTPAARWHADLTAALDSGQVDAVIVASPGSFHESAVRACIDAKLPVMCEKPLAMDSATARRIVDHEATNVRSPLVWVGFHRRFDAGYHALRTLIRRGEAGALLGLHCRHRNPQLPAGWDSSMLLTDAAAHEMDIVAWLAAEPIVSVQVRPLKRNRQTPDAVVDPILLLLETSSGVLADVEINMNVQSGYQVITEAVLEAGVAQIGGATGEPQLVHAGSISRPEHQTYVTRFAAAYDNEIQAWVNHLHGAPFQGATAWDGYQAVRLCEAGLEAASTEQRVSVAEMEIPAVYT